MLKRGDLLDVMAGGESPREDWRVGTEYETFAFTRDGAGRLPYEATDGGADVLSLLTRIHEDEDSWQPDRDGSFVVGLHGAGGSITLEPGGQFELSGRPFQTVHEMKAELDEHLRRLAHLSARLGVRWCWAGADPLSALDDIPWMPKRRYAVMRRYLPSRGSLALNMMKGTCTVQANVDYADEQDMGRKLRTALGLSSIVTALFANSPLSEGRPSGRLSSRSHVWTQTDPDRCGLPAWAFDGEWPTYERYLDYALSVPLFFLVREGAYLDCAGLPFRDLMKKGFQGHGARLEDWLLHLSTLFPDVRAKTYLETRSADCVPPALLPALPALWKGILYDDDARSAAWDLVRSWTMDQRIEHRDQAARHALGAPVPGASYGTRDLAVELLGVARYGLGRIATSSGHEDEGAYLDPLESMARAGRCPAVETLERLGESPGREAILAHYAGEDI